MTITATLTLLRHGETDYNKLHLMTGQRDIPLNVTGEAQAHHAGELLADRHIHVVFSSPLTRAFNTASIALDASGTQEHLRKTDGSFCIEIRDELLEQDVGDFTGRNYRTDSEVSTRNMAYDERSPNGESFKDVVEHVQKLYDEEILPRLLRGENVMISAHYVVLYAFEIVMKLAEAPQIVDTDKLIPNATPLVFGFDNGKFEPVAAIAKAANQNAPVVQNKKQAMQP